MLRPHVKTVNGRRPSAGGPRSRPPPRSAPSSPYERRISISAVPPAEQEKFVDVGAAAEAPGDHVVGVGPGGGDVAAGPAAAPVAGVQGFADPVRHDPVGAADLEWQSGGGIEDGPPYLGDTLAN